MKAYKLTEFMNIYLDDGGVGSQRVDFGDVHQELWGPERWVSNHTLIQPNVLLLTGLHYSAFINTAENTFDQNTANIKS